MLANQRLPDEELRECCCIDGKLGAAKTAQTRGLDHRLL
jgi:hypothetical protein